MTSELNLTETFRKILDESKVIQGRFIVTNGYASDLNADNFNQIFKDAVGGIKDPRKYPLAFMFPPVDIPTGYDETDLTRFKIQMFFLAKPFDGSAGIQSADFNNNTSTHTIEETWKDMRECAYNFRKVFIELTENMPNSFIKDGSNSNIKDVYQRYSKVGNDGLAGVGVNFDVLMHIGCEMNEYDMNDILSIEISNDDLHPLHEY